MAGKRFDKLAHGEMIDLDRFDICDRGVSRRMLERLRREERRLLELLDGADRRVIDQRKRIDDLLKEAIDTRERTLAENRRSLLRAAGESTLIAGVPVADHSWLASLIDETGSGIDPDSWPLWFDFGGSSIFGSPDEHDFSHGDDGWYGIRNVSMLSKDGEGSSSFVILIHWTADIDVSIQQVLSSNLPGNLSLSFDYKLFATPFNLFNEGALIRVRYFTGFASGHGSALSMLQDSPGVYTHALFDEQNHFTDTEDRYSAELFFPFSDCDHICLIPSKWTQPHRERYIAEIALEVYVSADKYAQAEISNLSFGFSTSDPDRDVWMSR